jgi:hypothetical protein
MFSTEELDQISKHICTILIAFLMFLNGFSITKFWPWTLRLCHFSRFHAYSNWHTSVLSYFFDLMFTNTNVKCSSKIILLVSRDAITKF